MFMMNFFVETGYHNNDEKKEEENIDARLVDKDFFIIFPKS